MEASFLAEIAHKLEEICKSKKDTCPFNLRQKFLLFSLPDKKLSTRLKREKQEALKLLEKEFILTDYKNFRKDMYSALKQILKSIKLLRQLNFCPDDKTKNQKLDDLRNCLKDNFSNYSILVFSNITGILSSLYHMHPAQYETADKICKILTLKKDIKDAQILQITTQYHSEYYCKILQIEESKMNLLAVIDNELLTFKYALTDTLNDELIFALAYVNPDFVTENAPQLGSIIRKRTMLYKNMWTHLPHEIRPSINSFNLIQMGKFRPDDRDFVYNKIRPLIRTFRTYFHSALGRKPELTLFPSPQKLEIHLDNILLLSSETDLLNIKTSDRTNLDFIMSTFDLTLEDIGNVLGISKQAISQQLKKDPLKLSATQLWNFARIFNSSIDFWEDKTTVPSYGKVFAKLDDPLLDNNDEFLSYLKMPLQLVADADKLLSYMELQVSHENYIKDTLYHQEKTKLVLNIIRTLRQKLRNKKYPIENLNLITQLMEKL